MSSTPIRQPRGPPSNTAAFSGATTSPSPSPSRVSPSPQSRSTSTGPPPPDAESILRRNKTVATGARASPAPGFDNQTAASGVSLSYRRSMGPSGASAYTPAQGTSPVPVASTNSKPSSGFVVASRYRSGSLSGAGVGGGLGHGHVVPPPPPGMGVGVGVPVGPPGVGPVSGNLARRPSGRDFRALAGAGTTEETLLETEAADEHASTATERGTWGKGLSRQSSLPSRRLVANGGVNPGLFTPAQPAIPGEQSPPGSDNHPPPPPRPPRRVYHPSVDHSSSTSPPPITSGHSRSSSHGLSLSVINPAGGVNPPYDISPVATTPGSAGHGTGFPTPPAAGVSRTQSLRAQMQSQTPGEYSTLGRSASMRTPGELTYSRMHASPPPPHPFSVATPPRPTKSNLYPGAEDPDLEPSGEIRRHQSLTYGASARTRERLERSQALLSLDQREDLRRLAASPGAVSASGSTDGHGRRHSRHLSIGMEDSPIGRSVWAPSGPMPGDDGWGGSSAALQDALESLSISGRDQLPGVQHRQPTLQHPGEEPAWVTNLVGMPGQPSPQATQRPLWDERGVPSHYGGLPPQWAAGHQLQPPLSLYQQQQVFAQAQAQLKLGAAGLGGGPISPVPGMQIGPGYHMPPQGYLGTPFTPTYPTAPPIATPPSANIPTVPQLLTAQDLDVLELARSKGLNPATFDCNPPFARFFVIKSYTEDDVQKSLKHGIWSSTVLGNKRLDAAYRESHERGPIYLFFSVNGSRHFCGVAEMTSPVDETRSSTVWAQDKWKGIFSVSWIFVRDISNLALRHIRLNNTPERKPITNTRDTTEVPYENGCEVLQIFLDHQHKSKTSLLQDFAYYERLSATRDNTASPQPAPHPAANSGPATPTPPMGYNAGPVTTPPNRV